MTDQDRKDLILCAEAAFWDSYPYTLEVEAAFARVWGRYDLVKVFTTYAEAACGRLSVATTFRLIWASGCLLGWRGM